MNSLNTKKSKTANRTLTIKNMGSHYQPDWRRSLWQIVNSVIPYMILLVLMYFSLAYSYLVTLLLAIPAAGFVVRIFIIFHDCGHGAFFKSGKLNALTGYLTGLLAFVPYHDWRFNHARHHATCSDLDRRGVGDIWTLTVSEYQALTKRDRFFYHLYRHPLILLGIGPTFLFLIGNRFVSKGAKIRERRSVHLTNLGILVIALFSSWIIGLEAYLMIQLPIIIIASTAGVWLFYIQHQFEDAYWQRHDAWDFFQAALKGSSFYKLPKILQWFTGNIGYHHVHHFNARIPNYYLQNCHELFPELNQVRPLTFLKSLQSLRLRLWDEKTRRMVGFKAIHVM